MATFDNIYRAYHLDEASGNALDALLTTDLTDVNTVGSASGKLSGARDFEAGSVERLYGIITQPGSYSDFGWVNFESLASGGNNMFIRGWTNADRGGGQVSGVFGLMDSTQKIRFHCYDGSVKTVDSTTTISASTWYHIGITVSAGGLATLYINGTSEGTVSVGTLFNSWSAGPYYSVGGSCGGFAMDFDGLQDEINLFNVAKSGTDAAAMYNSGTGLAYSSGGGAYTLTAAQGSFTYTGQSSALQAARRLAAAQGSYTLTGQAASLLAARILSAAQGAYTLTGQAASLAVSRRLAAGHGSYTLTGQDASLVASQALTLIAEQGSFTLSGQAAGLTVARRLSAEAGTFALTGQAAVLKAARRIAAGQGSIVVTGQDVTLTYSGAAVVVPASITVQTAYRLLQRRRTHTT